jgi:hypothetical protein
MEKKQIVYILSTNYAGSHFLALMLASHSRCASIGEVHRFRRKVKRRDVCLLCGSDDICPVFKGVSPEKLPCLYDTIFSNLREFDPGVRTVIDNSKKTAWAEKFLDLDDYDLKFIHLIRDPRALVRRWLMNNETPGKRRKKRFQLARHNLLHAPRILTGSDEAVFAYKWLVDNQRITRFLEKNGLDYRIVTYRDIVVETNREIEKTVQWLGDDFEPDQVNYWKYVHHGSRKKDYDFAGKDGNRVFDLRWKNFLSENAKLLITENKYLNRYLDKLEISINDDGLVFK